MSPYDQLKVMPYGRLAEMGHVLQGSSDPVKKAALRMIKVEMRSRVRDMKVARAIPVGKERLTVNPVDRR